MNNEKCFFAAANGYGGFISYFDSVFVSSDYRKIYVLKGGPGTGKSSFMKTVKKELTEMGCECESIYCSSDPKSLDGIICEHNGKKIAVLDGTAPHERDAVIPGAIDEIINLGDAWDPLWLSGERDKILKINKEKKKAYQTAYSYLKICGSIMYETDKLSPLLRNDKKLKVTIKSKAEPFLHLRLISSFGKYGKYGFNTLDDISDKVFSVSGEERQVYMLMGEIYEKARSAGGEITHFPSPLDKSKTEAVYLHETKTAYIAGGNGEKIHADKYFKKSDAADTERVKALTRMYDTALKESERWFNIASDLHFRLEDIYSEAMDFSINNKILEEKLPILKKCLDLQ